MTIPFEHSPTVALLSRLVHAKSLSQSKVLAKATRLWVILRSIYGNDGDEVNCDLNSEFTYSDWLKYFFREQETYHNQRDQDSYGHQNEQCPCHKTLKDWLFYRQFPADYQQWINDFNVTFAPPDPNLTEQFLENFHWTLEQEPNNTSRIFACVGRTLTNHFKELVKDGYLIDLGVKQGAGKKNEHYYCRVDNIHKLIEPTPSAQAIDYIPYILHEDFNEIPALFHEKIAGTRRFFMHVDYAVSSEDITGKNRTRKYSNRDWAERFKSLWENNPTPIVSLQYNSVSLNRKVTRIVYPVCIYYYQRAIYLCAYGQIPRQKKTINWYNYRLDRILEVTELNPTDQTIPQDIHQAIAIAQRALEENHIDDFAFTPDQIKAELAEAMGFDFYQPKQTMILRFDHFYSEQYIDESFRHETFKKIINAHALEAWQAQQNLSKVEQQRLIEILKQWRAMDSENPTHSYFLADYRTNDNNVIMRLRAWGDKVEVLYPPTLRQRMADDSRRMAALYQNH